MKKQKMKNVTTAKLFNVKPLFELLLEKDYYLCIESEPRITIFGVDPARFALFYAPNIKEILTKVDMHTDLNIFLREQVLKSNSTIYDVMQYVMDNHLDTKGVITSSFNAHAKWCDYMEDIMYQLDADDYFITDSEDDDSLDYNTMSLFTKTFNALVDVSFPAGFKEQQKILDEVTKFITNDLLPVIFKFEITTAEFKPLLDRARFYITELGFLRLF